MLLLLLVVGPTGAQERPNGSPEADLPAADVPLPQLRPETDEPRTERSEPNGEGQDESGMQADPAEPQASKPPEVLPLDVTPAESVEAARAVEDALLCEEELRERGAQFTVGPSFADGDCGVLRPVTLSRGSTGVEITPDTQMLCRTALALDVWMTDSLAPAARREFEDVGVQVLRHASTYVCRERASESRISEHSRGSAVDIGAVILTDGREIAVKRHPARSAEELFLAALRQGACGPFRTVLGPGTDADHADHFHFDIAARNRDSTYCR